MDTKLQSSIETRENLGGCPRAYVQGTRVRVQDIYVMSEIEGLSAEGIVQNLPHLTLGQVYAALSYYWDNRDAIHQEMREDDVFAEEARRRYGPGPLERKLKERNGGPPPIPPG